MADKLQVEYIPIGEIIPYDKNPRKNDKAADIVAKSIKMPCHARKRKYCSHSCQQLKRWNATTSK